MIFLFYSKGNLVTISINYLQRKEFTCISVQILHTSVNIFVKHSVYNSIKHINIYKTTKLTLLQNKDDIHISRCFVADYIVPP